MHLANLAKAQTMAERARARFRPRARAIGERICVRLRRGEKLRPTMACEDREDWYLAEAVAELNAQRVRLRKRPGWKGTPPRPARSALRSKPGLHG